MNIGADFKSIAKHHDEYASFSIMESKDLRALVFENSALHSLMDMRYKHIPQLDYMHPMLDALKLCKERTRLLLIGLGAGSMVHYLRHHYPTLNIVVLERSAQIIECARSYFELPNDDKYLSIICTDAEKFVAGAQEFFDAILVDVADDSGLPENCSDYDFFTHCYRILNDSGLLAVNMCQSQTSVLQSILKNIRSTFLQQCITIPIKGYGNMVACSFKTNQLNRIIKNTNGEYLFDGLSFDTHLGLLASSIR